MLLEVAVDTVIAGVQFSADEPFPEGRITGIEDFGPLLIPCQLIGVFFEALGEMFLAEALPDFRVLEVGLLDKFFRGLENQLLFPVNRNLRFAYFRGPFLFVSHRDNSLRKRTVDAMKNAHRYNVMARSLGASSRAIRKRPNRTMRRQSSL
jgi:hypothetical protein